MIRESGGHHSTESGSFLGWTFHFFPNENVATQWQISRHQQFLNQLGDKIQLKPERRGQRLAEEELWITEGAQILNYLLAL